MVKINQSSSYFVIKTEIITSHTHLKKWASKPQIDICLPSLHIDHILTSPIMFSLLWNIMLSLKL